MAGNGKLKNQKIGNKQQYAILKFSNNNNYIKYKDLECSMHKKAIHTKNVM